MKNFKLMFSAFAVLAIVGSALAFKAKAFNQGKLYCFANGDIPNVVQTEFCTVTGQPVSTKIDWQVVTTGTNSTNPCPVGQTPFDGASGTACVQTTPGTTLYATTPH
jgi:hypothetical protein